MIAMNIVAKNAAGSALAAATDAALAAAVRRTDLTHHNGIYAVDGMSGLKYRYFINTLVGAVPNARYLEIGSWAGSTLCAAIHGNKVTAVAVDDWSQFDESKLIYSDYNLDTDSLKRIMTFTCDYIKI